MPCGTYFRSAGPRSDIVALLHNVLEVRLVFSYTKGMPTTESTNQIWWRIFYLQKKRKCILWIIDICCGHFKGICGLQEWTTTSNNCRCTAECVVRSWWSRNAKRRAMNAKHLKLIDLQIVFSINILTDNTQVHPECYCPHSLQRVISTRVGGVHHRCALAPFAWEAHTN